MLRPLLLGLLLFSGTASSNGTLVGVWESATEDVHLHILDGFKSTRGAVLFIDNGTDTTIGYWETKGYDTTIHVRWRSGPVRTRGTDSFEWNDMTFSKRQGISEDDVVVLREDETGFIDGLRRSVWLTSDEGRELEFKSTFSIDSGVVETFSKEGDLYSLHPWGVSSGVLKIANVVIVEARVSRNYLLGQDHEDNFVIFRATKQTSGSTRTDLSIQRSDFLAALVTDTWQEVRYGSYITDHKFRPIEGPLRGRDIQLSDEKLSAVAVWEYSPSTGALKIGHTEYIGGLVIGDTLALLEDDGDQRFLKRKPAGSGKIFSLSDVGIHKVDETRGNELEVVLSGQFQMDDYLYSFEFNDDDRTGFVHKWRSVPFTIAGHEMSSEVFYKTKTIYTVEEFLISGDRVILKRDATASRLRPKTETEIVHDQQAMEKKLAALGQTRLILRVTDNHGDVHELSLPFASMTDIVGIEIVTRQE